VLKLKRFRASTRSFLLPVFSSAFFRRSHTTTWATWGLRRSYSQAALVPSSNVIHNSPRSPRMNYRTVLAFVSTMHSITSFPAPSRTAIEMLTWCTSSPIYFLLSIRLFLSVGTEPTLKAYSERAPPYNWVNARPLNGQNIRRGDRIQHRCCGYHSCLASIRLSPPQVQVRARPGVVTVSTTANKHAADTSTSELGFQSWSRPKNIASHAGFSPGMWMIHRRFPWHLLAARVTLYG
jgi:hypothetical protein